MKPTSLLMAVLAFVLGLWSCTAYVDGGYAAYPPHRRPGYVYAPTYVRPGYRAPARYVPPRPGYYAPVRHAPNRSRHDRYHRHPDRHDRGVRSSTRINAGPVHVRTSTGLFR